MLCAVPLLRALRQTCASASITLVTRPVNHDIMLHHPYVDDVLEYDKRRLFSGKGGLWDFLRHLRSRSYDLAVVPATVSISTTSNVIARASGARIRVGPRSLNGIKNPTAWCFTTKVGMGWKDTDHRHQAKRNLEILAPLEITTDDLTHTIGLTPGEKRDAGDVLAPLREKYSVIAGFHPGAGKVPNRWRAERFAALAGHAARAYGAGILITEGPMDEEPVREMAARLDCPYTIVRNKPIRSVAAILDQLDVYITNDTGVLHIAGATSPFVLSLFGPTDPLEWAPIGPKNRYIQSHDGTIDSLSFEEARNMLDVIMLELRKNLKLG